MGAVDTYWVGQMGDALALAGLSAANQVFSSAFWIISFLPSVVTPLIAKAAAAGDKEKLQDQVCEAMWLGTLVGLFGTVMLLAQPNLVLKTVLQPGAPALEHAVPYLKYRTISFLPALLSTIGFATYRGKLDTVTPLKISVSAQLLNVILDPILIFKVKGGTASTLRHISPHPTPHRTAPNRTAPRPSGLSPARPLFLLQAKLGVAGAAAATAAAQIVESVIYMNLLLKQQVGSALGAYPHPSLDVTLDAALGPTHTPTLDPGPTLATPTTLPQPHTSTHPHPILT